MKKRGWEGELIAFIADKSRAEFRAGVLDCAMFFADGVLAMTGEDIAAPFRGKYRSILKGYELLQAKGFADHVEYVASVLPELSSPLMAQRGDGAVALDQDGNPALGIVQGEKVYFMTLQGITLAPLTACTRAFRV